MDITEFLTELKLSLKQLDFVDSFEIIKLQAFEVKVRITLKPKGVFNVWYNLISRNQSFSLIIENERIWGIDHDKRMGWHEHSLNNQKQHLSISPQTIDTIINKLKIIWSDVN